MDKEMALWKQVAENFRIQNQINYILAIGIFILTLALLIHIGTAACLDVNESVTGNTTYDLNATTLCVHLTESNLTVQLPVQNSSKTLNFSENFTFLDNSSVGCPDFPKIGEARNLTANSTFNYTDYDLNISCSFVSNATCLAAINENATLAAQSSKQWSPYNLTVNCDGLPKINQNVTLAHNETKGWSDYNLSAYCAPSSACNSSGLSPLHESVLLVANSTRSWAFYDLNVSCFANGTACPACNTTTCNTTNATDCRRNITQNIICGSNFTDNSTNITIFAVAPAVQSCDRSLFWNLTAGSSLRDGVCNITAYCQTTANCPACPTPPNATIAPMAFSECYNWEGIHLCAPDFPKINEVFTFNDSGSKTWDKFNLTVNSAAVRSADLELNLTNCSAILEVNGTAFCADGYTDCDRQVLFTQGRQACDRINLEALKTTLNQTRTERDSLRNQTRATEEEHALGADATQTAYLLLGIFAIIFAYMKFRSSQAKPAGGTPQVIPEQKPQLGGHRPVENG